MRIRLFAMWLLSFAATFTALATNTVKLTNTGGAPGSTIIVSVALDSDKQIAGLQLSLNLPEGTDYVAESADVRGRAASMKASGGVRDGVLNLTIFSLNNKEIPVGQGTVMTFSLKLGDTPLQADLAPVVILASSDGSNIAVTCEPASLEIDGASLSISQLEYSLGSVALGEVQYTAVNVTNTGTNNLVITGLKNAPDGWTLPSVVNVAAGQSKSVELRFVPCVRNEVDDIIRFESNAVGSDAPVIIHSSGYGRNEMSLLADPVKGGETATVNVNLKNYDSILGFTLKVRLPQGFNFTDGSFKINKSRSGGHGVTATSETFDDHTELVLTAYSLNNTPFMGNDGVVASFDIDVMSRNSGNIEIKSAILPSKINGRIIDVVSATSGNRINVSSPALAVERHQNFGRSPITLPEVGTVRLNNHGSEPLVISHVSCDDEAIELTSEMPMTVQPWSSAQLEFNRTDDARGNLSHIVIIHSNDPETPELSVDIDMERYSPNEVILKAEQEFEIGNQIELGMYLDNYDEVEGIQFDLKYDTRLDGVIDIKPVGRAQRFECTTSRIESGCVRVLCYCMGLSIQPGYEKILNITFNPSNLSADRTYIIDAVNVILANSELDNVYSGEISAAISLPGNTAIEDMLTDSVLVTVFDLQGMELMRNASKERLNDLPTGLYIINGVKTYIRH